MNQQEYIQIIDEMKIPLLKILNWINIINQENYSQYNRINWREYNIDQDLLQEVVNAAHKLNDIISNFRPDEHFIVSGFFTHTIGGPIMTIRDNTKLVLFLKYKNPDEKHPDEEDEYIRYLKKINSASEYLSSLNWDAILKILQDHMETE